jgi:hypothetical protein
MLSGRFRVLSKRSKRGVCAAAALVLSACALALSIVVGIRISRQQPSGLRSGGFGSNTTSDQSDNNPSSSFEASSTSAVTNVATHPFAIVMAGSSMSTTTGKVVVVVPIVDDAVIDVMTLGDLDKLDVHVQVVQPVDYVEFSHNGEENLSRSYMTPYSFCGGMIRSQCIDLFTVGEHTIVATPFSSDGGELAGQSLVVSYVITDDRGNESVERDIGSVDDASAAAPKEDDLVQIRCETPSVSLSRMNDAVAIHALA